MAEPLKDQLYNAEKVRYLAGLFSPVGLEVEPFCDRVIARFPELELKERLHWIADCLAIAMPGDLPDLAPKIRAALPEPLDPTRQDDDFGDFIFAPLGEWVGALGLADHPDLAFDLFEDLTQRFSMEWAIRPFLKQWPDLGFDRLHEWSNHPNYHVRRLVSEGSRPRLPWGMGIDWPLERSLPLLDALHGDGTRYVTRSVANHLNDITKKQPDLVLERLVGWKTRAEQQDKELEWMTRHALRGLVKSGHAEALRLVGFDPDAPITVVQIKMPDQVAIDDRLEFEVTLHSPDQAGALVDFLLWRRMADGSLAPKVFKLRQVDLQGGERATLKKAHHLKGNATTFTLRPGQMRLEIQVNGKVLAGRDFELVSA